MKTSELEIYGIPRLLVDCWRENIGEELLPLQENAIKECGLLENKNLIISAPTSSGKTFCGEIAMAQALIRGQKAIYLVPLKALAEERFRDFQRKYEPLGLKTIISSGDRREFDHALEQGDFNLAVIIIEKFNQILIRNLDILSFIDLIIVDELQMISDRSRGAVLELALLKILQSKYECRLIGLSAVLSGAKKLAAWMKAELLVSKYRPVDLYQGVFWDGTFYYKKYNSNEKGSQNLLSDDTILPEDQLVELVRRTVESGEKVLVFLKSKAACHQFAELTAENLAESPCLNTIEKLRAQSATAITETLLELVSKGVAVHHADLSYQQREIIEEGYKHGKIKIIFATTTLSMGLNLPAGTVFLEPYKFTAGAYTQRVLPQHLDCAEYENMCGRAGRLGYARNAETDPAVGRAIILVNSQFEKEVIWSKFILGRPSELTGQLREKSHEDIALDLIASGCCSSYEELRDCAAKSFSSQTRPLEISPQAIEQVSRQKWIEANNEKLSVTSSGKVISNYGLSCQTARRLQTLLSSDPDQADIFWLYEILDTVEMRMRGSNAYRAKVDTEQIHELTLQIHQEKMNSFRLTKILSEPELQDNQQKARIAQALALAEWCRGSELAEIEIRYYVPAGITMQSAEIAAWLAESISALARVCGLSKSQQVYFKQMAFSLQQGLPIEVRKLHKLFSGRLSRSNLRALYHRRILTFADLQACPRDDLLRLIGAEATDRIVSKLQSIEVNLSDKEDCMRHNNHKLVLEGKFNRDRLTVRFFGQEVPLTMKSFKYLAKLASAKLFEGTGWIHKEHLEPGFNQARYIYNLKKELGLDKNQGVLENNRGGYYRLNLNPEEIRFNLENLKGIQDYELSSIVEKFEICTAVS